MIPEVKLTQFRYLVSEQSERYLEIFKCNAEIALTCIGYLSSDCFDLSLSNEQIKEGILSGAYVLQTYAVSQWLQHIKDAVLQNKEHPDFDFCYAVHQFIEKRQVQGFKPPISSSTRRVEFLQRIEPDWPMTSHTLKYVAQFHERREQLPLKQSKC